MDSRPTTTEARNYREIIVESLKVIIVAAFTVFVVRYFLFKPFYVKGPSMEPTFRENEYLIIDELSYRFHDPKRGDVVVFKYPDAQKDYFIKRVLGLPGERVKVSDGKVTIYNDEHPQGIIVTEDYLPQDTETVGEQNVVLGDSQYFVLGDNRVNSYDSRRFGPMNRDQIVGRVLLRGWPFKRAQIFSTPEFNI